jgi:hypothetical protein
MSLLAPGYWPTTYWTDSYWAEDYWPDYGLVSDIFGVKMTNVQIVQSTLAGMTISQAKLSGVALLIPKLTDTESNSEI